MRTIEIHGQTGLSTIVTGESLDNLANYIPRNTCTIIITDHNLYRLYKDRFSKWDVIQIGTGEKVKTLDTLQQIYRELVTLEMDRSGFIVGIGGGIVCDIAGFAASTFMRGLDFGFVSTSLLSQVDASTGGKNGVNFQGYKNMIGVFNQPRFVICDTAMLETLPRNELISGFAEVIKHAAIGSEKMFRFLWENAGRALRLDREVLEQLVYDSVMIKAAVVAKDEREKGERRKLNFGHTFGHAIEITSGLSHGEAISIGMVFAANLSVKRGLLERGQAGKLKDLLVKFQLPVTIDIDKKLILDALKKDKKREGGGIHFVLLEKTGKAVVHEIPFNELEEVIRDMR